VTERVVVLKGPFTDGELREIVEAVQRIEERRPDETFNIAVDVSDADADAAELLSLINPRRADYARIVKFFPRKRESR
jgi:hypothetical protein